jgi:hypothetical protein
VFILAARLLRFHRAGPSTSLDKKWQRIFFIADVSGLEKEVAVFIFVLCTAGKRQVHEQMLTNRFGNVNPCLGKQKKFLQKNQALNLWFTRAKAPDKRFLIFENFIDFTLEETVRPYY